MSKDPLVYTNLSIALAFGKYSEIPDYELPNNGAEYKNITFQRFRQRHLSSSDASRERRRLQKKFQRMAENIQFRIVSGRADRLTGLPADDSFRTAWGTFVPSSKFQDHSLICLAYEMMEPLVDNKRLNSAERATDIFRLTCSLLHEVAVSNS
jgi:hypothetical protein